MFQISCSKTANAGTSLINGTASKIIYKDRTTDKIYIKNADGTGSAKTLNIVLSSGFKIMSSDEVSLHSDGDHIYFMASQANETNMTVFRCDMTGSNVTQLTTEANISKVVSIF
jgi:Tol biopolymer transport system component